MTNEQRIEAMQKIALEVAAAGKLRRCADCRFLRLTEWDYTGSGASCTNPVFTAALRVDEAASRRGALPLTEARSERGLCGPDGLLWQRKTWHYILPRYRRHDLAKAGQVVAEALVAIVLLGTLLAHFFQ